MTTFNPDHFTRQINDIQKLLTSLENEPINKEAIEKGDKHEILKYHNNQKKIDEVNKKINNLIDKNNISFVTDKLVDLNKKFKAIVNAGDFLEIRNRIEDIQKNVLDRSHASGRAESTPPSTKEFEGLPDIILGIISSKMMEDDREIVQASVPETISRPLAEETAHGFDANPFINQLIFTEKELEMVHGNKREALKIRLKDADLTVSDLVKLESLGITPARVNDAGGSFRNAIGSEITALLDVGTRMAGNRYMPVSTNVTPPKISEYQQFLTTFKNGTPTLSKLKYLHKKLPEVLSEETVVNLRDLDKLPGALPVFPNIKILTTPYMDSTLVHAFPNIDTLFDYDQGKANKSIPDFSQLTKLRKLSLMYLQPNTVIPDNLTHLNIEYSEYRIPSNLIPKIVCIDYVNTERAAHEISMKEYDSIKGFCLMKVSYMGTITNILESPLSSPRPLTHVDSKNLAAAKKRIIETTSRARIPTSSLKRAELEELLASQLTITKLIIVNSKKTNSANLDESSFQTFENIPIKGTTVEGMKLLLSRLEMTVDDLAELDANYGISFKMIEAAGGLEEALRLQTESLVNFFENICPGKLAKTDFSKQHTNYEKLQFLHHQMPSLMRDVNSIELNQAKIPNFPSKIPFLPSVESVTVAPGKYSGFPSCILQMPNLKTLIILNNPIKTIPEGLSRLVKLENLTLANCNLKNFPPIPTEGRLVQLNITDNPKITKIPTALIPQVAKLKSHQFQHHHVEFGRSTRNALESERKRQSERRL